MSCDPAGWVTEKFNVVARTRLLLANAECELSKDPAIFDRGQSLQH